jgi:molecular chaperone GrpE
VSETEKNLNTISHLDAQALESGSVAQPVASEPQGQPAASTELEDLRQALATKTNELSALHDKYLRLAAEFENFKKLSQKEKQDYILYANETLLKDLLPIVDNLERALKYAQGIHAAESLVQGVELTLKLFMETLAKFGVKPFESLGAPFDPARHQAVARQGSNTVQVNTIIEEYQKGYLLHDRVLRAAMVAVSTGPSEGQVESDPAHCQSSEE